MNTYESNNIVVLSDIDHIKQRYGMYIGANKDPRALFAESLDNALDEVFQGAEEVLIRVDTSSNTYTIEDNGRGIPLGEVDVPEVGTDNILKVLTSRVGTGAKFNNNSFKIRSGMNGVGMAVITSLSSKVSYRTRRGNEEDVAIYEDGNLVSQYRQKTTSSNGVTVEFSVDDSSIFESSVIPKSYILDRCTVANAFLEGHIRLFIDDEEQKLDLKSILDLIPVTSQVFDQSIHKIKLDSGESMMIGLRFSESDEYIHKSYTNLLINYKGGTHEKLVSRSIRRKLIEMFDKDKELKESDIIGMNLVVACFIENPNFDSQTKEYLSIPNKQLDPFISKLENELEQYFNKHKVLYLSIMNRFLEYRRKLNNMKSSKDIMAIISLADESVIQKGLRPSAQVPKLIECSSKEVSNTELYIVEGNSAAGPFLKARDPRFHAILPLRGKILNVSKVDDPKEAFKNEEIVNIVNSVGVGALDNINPELCRYEKIIIAADSDPDGAQISSLVLGVFLKYLPELIVSGKLYIADSSLYGYYNKNKKFIPAKTLDEIPREFKSLRFKGLGSLEPDQLSAMLIDDATRNLLHVVSTNDLNDESLRFLRDSRCKYDILVENNKIINERGDI
jgi:DNA gyrase subunit B